MAAPPLSSCLDPGPILLHAGSPPQSKAKGILPSVAAFSAAKSNAEQAIASSAGAVAGFPFGKTRLKTYAEKLQLQKMLVEARYESAREGPPPEASGTERVPLASINIDGSLFGGRRSAPPATLPRASSPKPHPKPRAATSPEPSMWPVSGPGFYTPGNPASCGHPGGAWMGAYDTAASDQLREELGSGGSRYGMESVREEGLEKCERRDVPGGVSGRGEGGEGYQEALEELQDLRQEIQHMENTLQVLRPPNANTTARSPVSRTSSSAAKLPPPSSPPPANPLEAKLRQWEQQAFGPIVPVTRREAVALDETLDDIPQSASFGQSVAFGDDGSYEILDTLVVDRELELVDMVFREAARQVRAACAEQGRLLDKIRRRYGSFLHGLRLFCTRAQDASVRALEQLARAREREHAAAARAERLEQALGRSLAEAKALEERNVALQKELATSREEAEAQLVSMQAAVLTLQRENGHLADKVQTANSQTDAAVSTHVAYLQEDICALIDERDELQEKVERLTGQLVRSKWGGLVQANPTSAVATENQAVQTDRHKSGGEDGGSSEDEDDGRKRTGTADSDLFAGGLEDSDVRRRRRRRAKNVSSNKYGCFSGMLDTDRIGRVKPKGWLLKVIAQLYLEKSASDSFEARQGGGARPPELHEFVYDWHLNRYGLRTLAEAHLLDLIASVRRYQADNLKARMFGQFCGLVGAERRPPEAFQFYMHCMQVMAPSGILALFPETDDGTCWLKPVKALEAVKTIFTNAAVPLQLRQFIVSRIEPLIDPRSKTYDADSVLMALLDEWQRRYERNEAHLRALFRAGDANHDGVMTFDEWKEVIKHANDEMAEREIAQMFREALQSSDSPSGESIDPTTFVAIARKHRLWKWTFQPDVAGTAAAAASTEGRSPGENLFCMLDEALAWGDNPGDQLGRLRQKTENRGDKARAVVAGLEAKLAAFTKLYQERKDAEAAWASYRQLVGDLQHAVRRFNEPFKHAVRAILNIREFIRSASNSPAGSPAGDGPKSPFNRAPKPGASRFQEQAGQSPRGSGRRNMVRSSWRDSPAVKKTVSAVGGDQPGTPEKVGPRPGSGREVAQSAWRPGGGSAKPARPVSSLAPPLERPRSRNDNRPRSPDRPKSPPQDQQRVIPSSTFVAKLAPEGPPQPVLVGGRPGSPSYRVVALPDSISGVFGERVSGLDVEASGGRLGRLSSPQRSRPGSPEHPPGELSRAPSWEGARDDISVTNGRASPKVTGGELDVARERSRPGTPERSATAGRRPLSGLLGVKKTETPIWKSSTPVERNERNERKARRRGSTRRSSDQGTRNALSAVAERDDDGAGTDRNVSERSGTEASGTRLESIQASLYERLAALPASDSGRNGDGTDLSADLTSAPSFEEALKALERRVSDKLSDSWRTSGSRSSRQSGSAHSERGESRLSGGEPGKLSGRTGSLKKGKEDLADASADARTHNSVRFVDSLT